MNEKEILNSLETIIEDTKKGTENYKNNKYIGFQRGLIKGLQVAVKVIKKGN